MSIYPDIATAGRRMARWMLLCLCVAAFGPGRVEALEVLRLQSPAWLERAGVRLPLTPGDRLATDDRIITGPQARVLLRTGEGGEIRLGEAADFSVEELDPGQNPSGPYLGQFELRAGALRYTNATESSGIERDLRFRIGAVSAGVRGTDFWARAHRERDLLCLISGQIRITSSDELVMLGAPASLYSLPRGQVADPVRHVAPDQIQDWMLETALESGGVAALDGRWRVHLASLNSRDQASALRERLREAGYPVEVQALSIQGQQAWRVLLPGLLSAADARAIGARMEHDFKLDPPWVSRR